MSPSHDGDGASPLPRSRYVTGPIAYLDSSEIIPGRLGQCFREGAAAVIIAGDPAVAELWQLLMAEPSTMPWMASLYQLAANLLPHDDLTEALGDVYYFKPGRHSYIGRKIEIVADGETLVARPDRFDQPGGDQQMAVDLIEKCWRFCSIILIMIEATLRNGSSYFWRGPMILCGIAMTYSTPCVSHKLRSISSAASFPIP